MSRRPRRPTRFFVLDHQAGGVREVSRARYEVAGIVARVNWLTEAPRVTRRFRFLTNARGAS